MESSPDSISKESQDDSCSVSLRISCIEGRQRIALSLGPVPSFLNVWGSAQTDLSGGYPGARLAIIPSKLLLC